MAFPYLVDGTHLLFPCPSPPACLDFMFAKHSPGVVLECILEDTGCLPLKPTPLFPVSAEMGVFLETHGLSRPKLSLPFVTRPSLEFSLQLVSQDSLTVASVASKLSPPARLKTSPSLQIPLPFLLQIHLFKKNKAFVLGCRDGGCCRGADGSP